MYMKQVLEIGQASNGFVVECRVPIKPKKEKDSEKLERDYPMVKGSEEKQFVAKDAAEVVTLIEKLMPLLDSEFSSEEEFNSAFDKAAK